MVSSARRNITYLLLLLVILIVVLLFALSYGTVQIPFAKIIPTIFSGESTPERTILMDIRLPRLILAVAVGGGLSVAGAVFQAILLNPLAEPYILGVSGGGTFGAVVAIMLGVSFWGMEIFAFVGSLSVILLVFILGRRFGSLEPNILLLTGVMIGAFFSALLLLALIFLNESLRTAIFWLMGNLTNADMTSSVFLLVSAIIITVIMSLNAQKFNVLSLGDETALHLGVNIKRFKNTIYVLVSFLVGALVSVTGMIGFVGLVVPHSCRQIFGTDNRIVIPASFLLGAAFLVLADIIARTVIAPSEIPVGAITALIGSPIFIYLIRKKFSLTY